MLLESYMFSVKVFSLNHFLWVCNVSEIINVKTSKDIFWSRIQPLNLIRFSFDSNYSFFCISNYLDSSIVQSPNSFSKSNLQGHRLMRVLVINYLITDMSEFEQLICKLDQFMNWLNKKKIKTNQSLNCQCYCWVLCAVWDFLSPK